MEKYAVIMAGGSGTRLWPLSKEVKPKQFISVDEGACMLVQTIERICNIVPADKCFIITNENLTNLTEDTVKNLIPLSNIIKEPEKKNTAACIAYATLYLKEKFGEGLVCFVPADSYIKDNSSYKNAILHAFAAAERTDNLIIIGVTPTYPSTGYGYIQTTKINSRSEKILDVKKFIEKPDLKTAQTLIESENYLWNSGIVTGRTDTITGSIRALLPDHYEKLSQAIEHLNEESFNKYVDDAYNELQSISFDNGVLEKSKYIQVIRGNFDWDDIGSIDALSKTLKADSEGNAVKGSYIGIDTQNSIIYGDDIFIATIGINNIIVAATKEAVVVCPRERAQEVRYLVEKIKLNGYEDLV